MFNLEKSIQNWKRQLRSNSVFEDGDIAELESHLCEEIERLQADGFPEEEAFNKATKTFGEPNPIGDELYKTKTIKPDATPPWKQSKWVPSLLPNYIKVAHRNMRKEPSNSIINVVGLAVGFACAIVIFLFVRHETSYDDFHTQSEQIYRLVYNENYQGEIFEWAYSWSEWADPLESQFPEISKAVRLSKNQFVVEYENEVFREHNFYFADPEIFDLFDFQFTYGQAENVLTSPSSVIITTDIAAKYFGDEYPVGKNILINGEDWLEVSGVVEPLPTNSHLEIDFMVSFEFLSQEDPNFTSAWIYTYLLLKPSASGEALQAKLQSDNWFTPRNDFGEVSVQIQPITDIHLHSSRRGEPKANGNIFYVYIFSIAAIFILVITGLNYINLTSAGSFKRFREIGMRKTLGAKKEQLIGQFLGESILTAFLSLGITLLLLPSIIQFFNSYLFIELNTGLLFELGFILTITTLTLLVALMAGVYPALYLSSLNPLSTLKESSNNKVRTSKLWIRDGGVILQFAISTILLISTFIIKHQVDYIQNKDTGFAKEEVLTFPISNTPYQENVDLLKNNLLEHSGVLEVSASSTKPGVQEVWVGTFQPEGMGTDERNWIVPHMIVDHDFIDTYDITLKEGRNFSEDYPSDWNEAFIINEAAASNLGWDDPIGKTLQTWGDKTGRVIGVVEDFHFENLRLPVQPLVLHMSQDHYRQISVKINSENTEQVLGFIEQEWMNTAPGTPFEYSFLDSEYQQLYQAELRMGRLTTIFTIVAVFFACLGLWGLTAYKVKARKKEIGIRKVLGASSLNVTTVIAHEFIWLIFFAVITAIPAAWYMVNIWLNEYANRIELSWWMFALPCLVTLLFTLIAVSGLVLKAAFTDPVQSLKGD